MLALLPALHPAQAKKAKKPKPSPMEQAQLAADQSMLQAVEPSRQAALAAPEDANSVYAWAGGLSAAAETGAIGRGAVPQEDLDAFFAMSRGVADSSAGGDILGMASTVALAAGRKGEALDFSEQALAVKPTNAALKTWFQVSNQPERAEAHCKATLKAAASDIQRFDTVSACDVFLGGGDWTSSADRSWYEGEVARRGESQAAHMAQKQAEWAAQAQAMTEAREAREASRPEPSQSGSAPAGNGVVSVSLKVTCDQKVRMFEGSSPSSGGTYGWQSPNSVRSLSVRAGDVLCVADDSDKVTGSCWTASGSSASLELGCGGFTAR